MVIAGGAPGKSRKRGAFRPNVKEKTKKKRTDSSAPLPIPSAPAEERALDSQDVMPSTSGRMATETDGMHDDQLYESTYAMGDFGNERGAGAYELHEQARDRTTASSAVTPGGALSGGLSSSTAAASGGGGGGIAIGTSLLRRSGAASARTGERIGFAGSSLGRSTAASRPQPPVPARAAAAPPQPLQSATKRPTVQPPERTAAQSAQRSDREVGSARSEKDKDVPMPAHQIAQTSSPAAPQSASAARSSERQESVHVARTASESREGIPPTAGIAPLDRAQAASARSARAPGGLEVAGSGDGQTKASAPPRGKQTKQRAGRRETVLPDTAARRVEEERAEAAPVPAKAARGGRRKAPVSGGRKGRARASSTGGAPVSSRKNEVPDVGKLTLREIIRNNRIGAPSKNARVRKQKARKSQVEGKETAGGAAAAAPGDRRADPDLPDAAADARPTAQAETDDKANAPAAGDAAASGKNPPGAPQITIIDGKWVIDEKSLVVDQTGASNEKREYDVVYEDSNYITSRSFSQRISSDRWTEEETALFFKALQHFGTDFTLIAELFPKRQRRHIRNKYKREEKQNPAKVDAALQNRLPFDPQEYEALASIIAGTAAEAAEDGKGAE